MLVSKWSVFLASLVLPPAGFVLLSNQSKETSLPSFVSPTLANEALQLSTATLPQPGTLSSSAADDVATVLLADFVTTEPWA